MVWDNASLPMQSVEKLDDGLIDSFEQELMFAHDPVTTNAERIQSIIDAKYTKADLRALTEECKIIDKDEKKQLHQLLKKYEHLFDGTLGKWKTDPVELELQDPDCKPYHARPYPVPHCQERKLREEIVRLVGYGVFRKVNRSEWAAPMSTLLKPDASLRSLADQFRAPPVSCESETRVVSPFFNNQSRPLKRV
jgi:hypothetical protein